MLALAKIAEMKLRDQYSSEKAYTHINTRSSVQANQIADIHQHYQIPNTYELRALNLLEKMY